MQPIDWSSAVNTMTLRPFEAFPAHLVTPRLTTAEAIAQRIADSERASSAFELVSTEHTESGDKPARRYGITFRYADGTSLVVKPHGHASI